MNLKQVLYYFMAIYIGYMGFSILRNRLNGDNTMTYPLAIFFFLIFVLGAVWIIWYGSGLGKKERVQYNFMEETEKTEEE